MWTVTVFINDPKKKNLGETFQIDTNQRTT